METNKNVSWPPLVQAPQPVSKLPPSRRAQEAADVPRTADGFVVRLPTLSQAVSYVLRSRGIATDVAYGSVVGHIPVEDVRQLEREDRRRHLNMLALRLLTGMHVEDDSALWALVGQPASPLRLPMEYLTALWNEQIRDKTWMDALTIDQQAQFALEKQKRDAVFRECEKKRQAALEAMRQYQQALHRMEANAEVQLENWVLARVPHKVIMPTAKPDPLIESWDEFVQLHGLASGQVGNGSPYLDGDPPTSP